VNFYNISEPLNIHRLKVSDLHEIYIEEYGNRDGIPMLFLHGGPGAGISPIYQKYFDPKKYHLIMFDQRGSGKSKPYAETRENTTDDLINDINLILDYFSVDKTNIYGGSWGSTLALLYAESNPTRVSSLTLRGVFLCREDDISWFYQHGASEIYPHYWENYVSLVDKSRRDNILSTYHEMIHSPEEKISMAACKEWSLWEGRSSCLLPSQDVINAFDECSTSLAKIESHYFVNNCFIRDGFILKNVHKISKIPCHIIQGRHDIICPPINAYKLSKIWSESILKIVEEGAHSGFEDCMFKQIQESINHIVIDTSR